MYENVHPNLALVLLFVRTEVECGKGLLQMVSAISFGWFADLENPLPLFNEVQRWFQPVYYDKWGAFHYAKQTGQRAVGIPEENGTTFSD